MKDRYRKKGNLRSFIEPTDKSREEIVKEIITIKPVVEGKRVIVVDDSIVRGTSSKNIIRALRDAGAKKVYMVVTFPQSVTPATWESTSPHVENFWQIELTAKTWPYPS